MHYKNSNYNVVEVPHKVLHEDLDQLHRVDEQSYYQVVLLVQQTVAHEKALQPKHHHVEEVNQFDLVLLAVQIKIEKHQLDNNYVHVQTVIKHHQTHYQ